MVYEVVWKANLPEQPRPHHYHHGHTEGAVGRPTIKYVKMAATAIEDQCAKMVPFGVVQLCNEAAGEEAGAKRRSARNARPTRRDVVAEVSNDVVRTSKAVDLLGESIEVHGGRGDGNDIVEISKLVCEK